MDTHPADLRAPHLLLPGDVACGERGDRFESLLGSCVAVVMTDPRRTVGAMCHIVLPAPAPLRRARDTAFADVAMAEMGARLRARGLQPGLCEAYVYGGGNMFPAIYAHSPIGDRSVQQVLQALADQGVRVLHHDVGGAAYRKLAWTVGPGEPSMTAIGL